MFIYALSFVPMKNLATLIAMTFRLKAAEQRTIEATGGNGNNNDDGDDDDDMN